LTSIDNLAALDVSLSEDEIQQLDKMTQSPPPYPAWMQGFGNDAQLSEADVRLFSR